MEKKRDWMKIATLVLCVVLVAVNLRQGKRIDALEQNIWNAQNSIMNDIRSMESTVYSQLQEANTLVQDWDSTSSVDMKTHALLVEVSVVLKEWREDTSGKLAWTNLWGNGSESSVPLTAKGTGRFAGTLEIPLADIAGEFQAAVVVQNGEIQRREELGYLGDIARLLPIRCYGYGISGPVYSAREGTFAVSECDVELDGEALELDRVTEQTFRLTRNGNTVAEQAAKAGDRLDEYTCGELSTKVQPGDEVILTFFCQDQYGLGYEFFLNGWSINKGNFGDTVPEWEYPKLTWN